MTETNFTPRLALKERRAWDTWLDGMTSQQQAALRASQTHWYAFLTGFRCRVAVEIGAEVRCVLPQPELGPC